MKAHLKIRFNQYSQHLTEILLNIFRSKTLCDVRLIGEDDIPVDAHKVILAASSPFFKDILKRNKHPHPLVYLRGVKARVLEAMLDFIYQGEANIFEDQLDRFLALAEELELKGFSGSTEEEAPEDGQLDER